MTEVPGITQADLENWFKMQEQLTQLKAAESLLRKRIFQHYFTNPTEGVNSHPIGDGFVLKGGHVINRKVIEADLEALQASIKAEGSNLPKLPINKLVKWKPELVKSEYNKLSDDEKKVFERALEIKPGSPTLEIVKPKRGA